MKKKFLPIISSLALLMGSYNTVYANEEFPEEACEETMQEATTDNNEEVSEPEQDVVSYENEPVGQEDAVENNKECDAPEECNIESEIEEPDSTDPSEKNDTNGPSCETAEDELVNESDELLDEELTMLDEEIEEDEEDAEEVEDVETCNLHITYEQEVYEIENLCPTDEIIIFSTEASVSMEKGKDFSAVFDGTILNEDLLDKISLPETIQEDCEISFYINIDGEVSSKLETI